MSDCSINNVEFNIVYSKEEKNILKVNSKKEIFFEVFECSVFDDDSIVVEQTGLWNDLPLVYVEFIKENKKYSCEAVLVEDGTTEFVVNEDNLFYLDQIKKEEDKIQETENKVNEDIKLEINHTYDEKIKEYEDKKFNFLNELELQFEDKITNLKEDISIKLDTFFDKLEDKKKELIDDEIESITLNLNEKYDSFKKEVNELSDFNRDNIDSILENKITDIDNTVKLFLDNLTENYSSKFKNNDKKVTASLIEINSIRNKLKKYHENSEEKFNDLFKLEEKLVNQDDYSDKNKEIFEFINEELDRINNKFIYISEEENKKYNELLAAVSKTDVVEYKTILKEKIQDVELNLVKEELKSELSSNLKNEITSLKRYAEMSAGGGTNAVQYANGGTMNGNLNVNGNILSGGRNLDEIFGAGGGSSSGEYLPLSGGNLTGQLSSNNTIIAETILATNILSATNLDIGFELSGFNVTGSISANGDLNVNQINVSGDILPTENITYNIGSSALRFNDIFLAGNTIDLSGTKISVDNTGDVEFKDKNNQPKRIKASEIVLESSSDPNNDIIFKVDNSGNPEFLKRDKQNPNNVRPSTVNTNILSSVLVRTERIVTPVLSTNNANAKFNNDVTIAGNLDIGFPGENENQCIVIHGANNLKCTELIQTGSGFCINPNVGNQFLVLGSNSNNITYLCGNGTHQVIIPTGKVNIGTTGGTEKLTVAGNISASGGLSANNIYGNEIYDNGNRVCTSFPSQTLQSVTDNGKITTNDIQVANLSATGNIIANPISNRASSSSGILAGSGNCATGNYSIVVGGRDNIASGNCSVVVGGGYRPVSVFCIPNCATASHSVVVGGFGNEATACAATIVGGRNNRAYSTDSFIGAGCNNKVYTGHSSSILGGVNNKICHSKSFIIGSNMTTNADCTTFVNNLSSQYNLYSNNLTASCNVNIVGKTTVGKITLSDTSFVSESADFTLGEEHRGATVLLQNPSPMTVTVSCQVSGHVTSFIAETNNNVNFSSGNGLSGLNSFNGASNMQGQFAQAQITFKTPEYAFLGGQIS